MQPWLHIGIKAARAAGKLILKHFDSLEKVTVQTKGDRNFVTAVDRAAEAEIIHIIRRIFPAHAILAEESGSDGKDDVVWIIDPLDGTTNFIHGIPHFCVSIAIEVKGRIEQGIIYDPFKDELFTAIRGSGASLNDRRIRVSQQPSIEHAMLCTGFPYAHPDLLVKNMEMLKSLLPQISGLRRTGSAALDLAYVASGRFDAFWEFNLKAWDVAAGSLMVREAGGMVTTLTGEENFLHQGSILASNLKLQKQLLQRFSPVLQSSIS